MLTVGTMKVLLEHVEQGVVDTQATYIDENRGDFNHDET